LKRRKAENKIDAENADEKRRKPIETYVLAVKNVSGLLHFFSARYVPTRLNFLNAE
jgi:hypothetical protein